MSKIEQILVLVIVGGLLLVPHGARLLGARTVAFENRPLAALPEWKIRRAFDQQVYAELTEYLDDHLPLRRQAVDSNARIALELFGDSPTPRVHLGTDSWLYFDDALRRACENDTPIDELLDHIQEMGDVVRASGRRFLFVLVPNKYTLHPEYGTHRVHEIARCSQEKKVRLDEALRQRPVEGLLDLTHRLESTRDHTGQQVYFTDDSHLNPLGSTVMARSIVEFVRPGLWTEESIRGPRPAQRTGDLARMVRVRPPVISAWYLVRRLDVRILPTEIIPRVEGHPLQIFRSQSPSKELVEERVLLLHDSSMNLTRDMLWPYFADIATLDWEAFESKDVSAQIAAAATVIVEVVERGFYRRCDEQIGAPGFLAQLRQTLEAPAGDTTEKSAESLSAAPRH